MGKRICLFVAFLIVVCTAAFGKTVTDMAGRRVEVPARVRRVVTDRFVSFAAFALDPDMTANATFRVSAEGKKYISAKYYDHKPLTEAADEEILKLRPDVVLVGLLNSGSAEKADRLQKRIRVPVLVIDFRVDKAREAFTCLGDALGRKERASKIITFIDKYIRPVHDLTGKLPPEKRPRIYYAEGPEGLETEPEGSLHAQVFDYVHVRNVAKVSTGDVHGMSKASIEQILAWNPDAIVVWSGYPSGQGLPQAAKRTRTTAEHIRTDERWAKLKAVQSGKIYQVPGYPFGWIDRPPGHNCLAGVIWMAHTLYPNLLPYNAQTALAEFVQLFWHTEKVYDSH
jgi:iron complex transport system substrate-binding protein